MIKNSLKNMRVGVLGGGVSSEREVSLMSANNILASLKGSGIDSVFIDINTEDENAIKQMIFSEGIDIAFIALHGYFGEDGRIQAILERLEVLYTGSRPKPSLLAMDKISSKEIFLRESIPTPEFFLASSLEANIEFSKPVVVKPNYSGSSLGVTIVRDSLQLLPAIDIAYKAMNISKKGLHGLPRTEAVIVEEFISGRELTVGILGSKPLSVVEIIPESGCYDYFAKYNDPNTKFIAPANIDSDKYHMIQGLALRTHLALGCRHFSRVDFRLSDDGIAYVLEANSIPGFTSHSLLPFSAKASGINFDELILSILQIANDESKKNQEIKAQ
ncbi:MAG: D-alanine--D-alanine ligase [Candidatus Omnitrophota bacterium]